MDTYKVVKRTSRGQGAAIDWPAVERASAEGRAVEIPLEGRLNSTMHAALHHGAQRRGLKAHIRTVRDSATVEVWVEAPSPAP